MRQLQRRSALIVLTMSAAALLHAETTSKRDRISLNCPDTKVHVRIFDETGAQLVDFDWVPGNDPLERKDSESVEASKRYVTTSASIGCIQGVGVRDPETDAPVNAFVMPCKAGNPINLRITSDPPAKFIVRREIKSIVVGRDGQVKTNPSGVTCHWQLPLNRSPIIVYNYTPDEKLIIDGTAIADPQMTGHLELDADHVPRIKKIFPIPAIYGGSTARQLKSFTIERMKDY